MNRCDRVKAIFKEDWKDRLFYRWLGSQAGCGTAFQIGDVAMSVLPSTGLSFANDANNMDGNFDQLVSDTIAIHIFCVWIQESNRFGQRGILDFWEMSNEPLFKSIGLPTPKCKGSREVLWNYCLVKISVVFNTFFNFYLMLSDVHQNHLLFFFWPCRAAWEILVTRPEIEPRPLSVRVPSPNHWTAREFPHQNILKTKK